MNALNTHSSQTKSRVHNLFTCHEVCFDWNKYMLSGSAQYKLVNINNFICLIFIEVNQTLLSVVMVKCINMNVYLHTLWQFKLKWEQAHNVWWDGHEQQTPLVICWNIFKYVAQIHINSNNLLSWFRNNLRFIHGQVESMKKQIIWQNV